MSEPAPQPRPVFRSALAGRLPAAAPPDRLPHAGVCIAEWPTAACLVVRIRPDDGAALAAVQAAIGLPLPTTPSSAVRGDTMVAVWISPDEWWLLLPHAQRDTVSAALRQALAGHFAQVVDHSGAITVLGVEGPQHETVLRHLSPYDMDRLTPGRCVSTVLPKASFSLLRLDEGGVWLLFRRSFADWVWRLVQRSAEPYGLLIGAPASPLDR